MASRTVSYTLKEAAKEAIQVKEVTATSPREVATVLKAQEIMHPQPLPATMEERKKMMSRSTDILTRQC